jgi:transcription elongation factor GreA
MSEVYPRSPEWVNGRGFPGEGHFRCGTALPRGVPIHGTRFNLGSVGLYLAYNYLQTCGQVPLPAINRLRSMPEHIKKKLAEDIAILEHELNHELPKELKKAVAMGDLSENAEYHMAKQRQEFVRARLGQLKQRMADLSMVNMANIPRDRAAIGSTVVVFDSTKGTEIEYKLVTSEESDVTKGLISTSSPIGRALMGKKVGDVSEVVTPNGKRELEVLKLTTIHDEA